MNIRKHEGEEYAYSFHGIATWYNGKTRELAHSAAGYRGKHTILYTEENTQHTEAKCTRGANLSTR